jgi:DNA-binding transcriptional regulator YhcF (GntR family)
MVHLDKQHPLPLYLQLKEMLRSQIEQGIYFSHQKLPSERDLCQQYNLSRMTARRALQALIAEGLAYTRAGKGTFAVRNGSGRKKPGLLGRRSGRVDALPEEPASAIEQALVEQLVSFNCAGVERAISQALAGHSLEMVALGVFSAAIRRCEQQWSRGEISLPVLNYAITTLRSQLIAMCNAAPVQESGQKVVVGCAPEDQHEIGLLMLNLGLRRRGYQVIYLGPNGTASELSQVVETIRPRLVCFSAATTAAVGVLAQWADENGQAGLFAPGTNGSSRQPETILTFGGVAFVRHPALIPRIGGLYLGNSVEAALRTIQQLLAG